MFELVLLDLFELLLLELFELLLLELFEFLLLELFELLLLELFELLLLELFELLLLKLFELLLLDPFELLLLDCASWMRSAIGALTTSASGATRAAWAAEAAVKARAAVARVVNVIFFIVGFLRFDALRRDGRSCLPNDPRGMLFRPARPEPRAAHGFDPGVRAGAAQSGWNTALLFGHGRRDAPLIRRSFPLF